MKSIHVSIRDQQLTLKENEQAIRTYPNGNAVPDAYYRKGLALQALRRQAEAREAWEFLVKNYPDSTAALLAKQRLQQITPAQGR